MTKTTRILESALSLELLDQILDKMVLRSDHAANIPILVSIDTETSKERLCEIGISTFDPYCLLSASLTEPDSFNELAALNDRITTYCYAKGGSKDRHRYKPYRLGTPKQLRNDNIQHIFQTHLTPTDAMGNVRKVVLVGHGINTDLHFLERNLSLDISQMPNVLAVIDTSYIGQFILTTPQLPSLKQVLTVLELDFVGLHNAAHDSRYALRALLMLFTRSKQETNGVHNKAPSSHLQLIQAIARCHKIRPGRTWMTTTRVKSKGDPDVFLDDSDDIDNEHTGIAALFM